MVIDSQDDYSTALARQMTPLFRARGVRVVRESVSNTETDFSSIVTNVSSSTQVVVFATQTASAANTLANQLREQGEAVVMGTDGAYSPSQYKPRLGYVSSFAPDIRNIPAIARSSPGTRSSHPARRGAPSGRRRTSPAGS